MVLIQRIESKQSMFSKKKTTTSFNVEAPHERITSVIGPGINWHGDLRGHGGVRIEGTLEGEIAMRGMVVIGETGKVTCETLKAEHLIVAGTVNGNILCQKLEIRASGRIWGDVVTTSFASEDGAFLRGQMRMEDKINLDLDLLAEAPDAGDPEPEGGTPEADAPVS